MAKEALDGLEVVIGQEEVACVRVAKRVRRDPLGDVGASDSRFDGALNVGFMKMVPAHFAGLWHEGEPGGRKEPLPDIFSSGIFVFFFELPGKENPSIAFGKVAGVDAAYMVHLLADLRESAGGQGHGSIFLAFAIVDGKEH